MIEFEVVWVLYNERIKRYVYANNKGTAQAGELRDALVLLASSEGMHDLMNAPLFKDNGVRVVGAFVREKGTPIELGNVIVNVDEEPPEGLVCALCGLPECHHDAPRLAESIKPYLPKLGGGE